LWNPDEIDGHNVHNARCEIDRHFKNKDGICENKINKQGTNGKNKNIRVLSGVDKFKVYQARTIFIKDDMGDMLAASHSILSRWKN